MASGERRRAFRVRTGLPGRLCLQAEVRQEEFSRRCLVCDISLSGCKVVLTGAGEEQFSPGRQVTLLIHGREPLQLSGRIARIAEVVDDWGLALGIHFQGLARGQRRAIERLLIGDDPRVDRATSRIYRHHRRRRRLGRFLLTAVALCLGFVMLLWLRQVPDRLRQAVPGIKREAVRLARDEWREMSPRQRRAFVKDLSADDVKRIAQSLSPDEQRRLYDHLTPEERERVRRLYRRSR